MFAGTPAPVGLSAVRQAVFRLLLSVPRPLALASADALLTCSARSLRCFCICSSCLACCSFSARMLSIACCAARSAAALRCMAALSLGVILAAAWRSMPCSARLFMLILARWLRLASSRVVFGRCRSIWALCSFSQRSRCAVKAALRSVGVSPLRCFFAPPRSGYLGLYRLKYCSGSRSMPSFMRSLYIRCTCG